MPPKKAAKPKAKPKTKAKPKQKKAVTIIKDKSVNQKQIVNVNVNTKEKKTRAKPKPKPKPEVDLYDLLQYRISAPQLQISSAQSNTPDLQTIKQMIENHQPTQIQNDINKIAGTNVRDKWAGRFDQHLYDGLDSVSVVDNQPVAPPPNFNIFKTPENSQVGITNLLKAPSKVSSKISSKAPSLSLASTYSNATPDVRSKVSSKISSLSLSSTPSLKSSYSGAISDAFSDPTSLIRKHRQEDIKSEHAKQNLEGEFIQARTKKHGVESELVQEEKKKMVKTSNPTCNPHM